MTARSHVTRHGLLPLVGSLTLPRRRVLPSGKSSPGHGQDYSEPSHDKQSKTQTSPPHMSRGMSTKARRYTKPRRSGVRAVDRSLVSRHEGYSFLGSRRSGGARRVLKEMRCGPTLSTKRIVQVPNAGNQLLAFPDYRSRTWCLSSVFRLGLRAKVAVI